MYKQVVLPDLPFKRGYCLKKIKQNYFLPTDPTKKIRVGKGQTKYFLI